MKVTDLFTEDASIKAGDYIYVSINKEYSRKITRTFYSIKKVEYDDIITLDKEMALTPLMFNGDDEDGYLTIKNVIGTVVQLGNSGIERRNRYTYELIEEEGDDEFVPNPLLEDVKGIVVKCHMLHEYMDHTVEDILREMPWMSEELAVALFKSGNYPHSFLIDGVGPDDLKITKGELKALKINSRILEEYWEIKKEKAGDLYNQYGDIAVVEYDTIEKVELLKMAGYVVAAKEKVANTQDMRIGRTHTYRALIINKKLKGNEIKVPEEFKDKKGLIIGKGGSKIKETAKELGKKYLKLV